MGLKRVFQNKLFEVTRCLKLQNHKKLNSFQYKLEGGLYWGGGVASNRMNFFLFTGRWTYSWGSYVSGLTDYIS